MTTRTFHGHDIEPIAPTFVREGDLIALRGNEPGEWHAYPVTFVRSIGDGSTRIEFDGRGGYFNQPDNMPVRIVRRDPKN